MLFYAFLNLFIASMQHANLLNMALFVLSVLLPLAMACEPPTCTVVTVTKIEWIFKTYTAPSVATTHEFDAQKGSFLCTPTVYILDTATAMASAIPRIASPATTSSTFMTTSTINVTSTSTSTVTEYSNTTTITVLPACSPGMYTTTESITDMIIISAATTGSLGTSNATGSSADSTSVSITPSGTIGAINGTQVASHSIATMTASSDASINTVGDTYNLQFAIAALLVFISAVLWAYQYTY